MTWDEIVAETVKVVGATSTTGRCRVPSAPGRTQTPSPIPNRLKSTLFAPNSPL
jgi:hypothetical protein